MALLKKLKKKWFVFAVAFLIMAFYLTPLRPIFSNANSPLNFIGGKFWLAGRSAKNFLLNLKMLPNLSRDLKAKDQLIIGLLGRITSLKEIERQNEELKKFIKLKEEKKYNLIAGKILNYRNFLGRNLVSINLGSRDGVALDWPVLSADNVLVGKVVAVLEDSSLFLPVTDPESLIAVSFLQRPEIQAVAAGRLNVSLAVDLIPQEADIAVGDALVTSPLEKNTPPGLLLGTVSDIEYKQGELFKKASVQPLVSLNNIDVVSVIIP